MNPKVILIGLELYAKMYKKFKKSEFTRKAIVSKTNLNF